jgi:hypothetical protein
MRRGDVESYTSQHYMDTFITTSADDTVIPQGERSPRSLKSISENKWANKYLTERLTIKFGRSNIQPYG